jgi:hypothetical protein
VTPEASEAIRREHRDLDALFGALLRAVSSGTLSTAVDAAVLFDEALRLHMKMEEAFFRDPAEGKLIPAEGESAAAALFRELRLEHVQVRELSGMIRRVLGEPGDVPAARKLAATLANRWDAHTAREEREWLTE